MLPAYNEAEALPPLFAAIDESMFDAGLAASVVVIDDGSKDGTSEVASRAAAEHGLTLLLERHPVNLGLGMTLRDGLIKAAGAADPRDLIVTLDADCSQPPALIPRLVTVAREGHDVVIASRYQPGSQVRGVPFSRRLLSFWASLLFRLVFPIPGVRDYTCGFRCYRAKLIQDVLREHGTAFFDQQGFQCMVDILLKLRREDLVFGEVPLVLRYDLKPGASKMRVAATIWNTLVLMVRRRVG